MKKYSFSGYVYVFGKCYGRVTYSTMAISQQKATSNIKYRFRKENSISPYSPIELDGEWK